jgi:hypothetical protein
MQLLMVVLVQVIWMTMAAHEHGSGLWQPLEEHGRKSFDDKSQSVFCVHASVAARDHGVRGIGHDEVEERREDVVRAWCRRQHDKCVIKLASAKADKVGVGACAVGCRDNARGGVVLVDVRILWVELVAWLCCCCCVRCRCRKGIVHHVA